MEEAHHTSLTPSIEMLTKIILEGPMGKEFGREWELSVSSANEALHLIDANKPGVFVWIRNNLSKYARYRVVVEYVEGEFSNMDDDDYIISNRTPLSIRFVPLIEGAGSEFKTVVGVTLMIASFVVPGMQWAFNVGAVLAISGAIEMLAPVPKKRERDESARNDKTSYYFDGPANTSAQGVPVSLIYGRVLAGSHPISAAVTVDQMISTGANSISSASSVKELIQAAMVR